MKWIDQLPTEQKSERTGLGMTIVKSLIEAHGGSIVVESKLQRGTKFTVTLPIDDVYTIINKMN